MTKKYSVDVYSVALAALPSDQ